MRCVVRANVRRVPQTRFSLRELVERVTAEAEQQAIRLALHATLGNKSEAARLLRVDYKTLHLKLKRYAIVAGDFRTPVR